MIYFTSGLSKLHFGEHKIKENYTGGTGRGVKFVQRFQSEVMKERNPLKMLSTDQRTI
jgi:hypothetical protein